MSAGAIAAWGALGGALFVVLGFYVPILQMARRRGHAPAFANQWPWLLLVGLLYAVEGAAFAWVVLGHITDTTQTAATFVGFSGAALFRTIASQVATTPPRGTDYIPAPDRQGRSFSQSVVDGIRWWNATRLNTLGTMLVGLGTAVLAVLALVDHFG